MGGVRFGRDLQGAEGFRVGIEAKLDLHPVAIGLGELVLEVLVLLLDVGLILPIANSLDFQRTSNFWKQG